MSSMQWILLFMGAFGCGLMTGMELAKYPSEQEMFARLVASRIARMTEENAKAAVDTEINNAAEREVH